MTIEETLLKNASSGKINNWFIMPLRNKIYGNLRLNGQPNELFINGDIYYYFYDMAYVRIDCKFYYLVLGNIDPSHADQRQEYYQYLKNKPAPTEYEQ